MPLFNDFPESGTAGCFTIVFALDPETRRNTGNRARVSVCGVRHPGQEMALSEENDMRVGILDQFRCETADMGQAEAARPIEPLCIL
jgi:hypothetical protein